VHGAGVLADRRIEDKTDENFISVVDTKVDGARSLLSAASGDDLRFLVFFSSSTARFGRAGQIDYAAANEILNKIAQRERLRRPQCRVLSINWGPWDGGMVTPGLKDLFAKEGVRVISLAAGAQFLLDALRSQEPIGPEIVVLGKGSATPEPIPVARASEAVPAKESAFALAFERTVDIESHRVLKSHVMDGNAVLPAALMIEWFAHAALHRNPGFAFFGVDEFRVLKGVIFRGAESRRLRVLSAKHSKRDGLFYVPVELRSAADDRDMLHARAEVVLAPKLPTAPDATNSQASRRRPAKEVSPYNGLLFHGKDLHGITSVDSIGPDGIDATIRTAPAPDVWMDQPLRTRWISDPLAIDAVFQALIVWSRRTVGNGSLPVYVRKYRQYVSEFPSSLAACIEVVKQNANQAVSDVEFVGAGGKLVAKMDGYECVIDASLNDAFKRNQCG
jgi:hypothetical protein